MSAPPSRDGERGQATVEFAALLPLIAVGLLACWQLVLVGQAAWSAHAAARSAARAQAVGADALVAARAAAEAGAAAILQDGDAQAAAEHALGTVPRERAAIEVSARRVTVTVRPGVLPRPLAGLLAATARADAGPGPAVDPSTTV